MSEELEEQIKSLEQINEIKLEINKLLKLREINLLKYNKTQQKQQTSTSTSLSISSSSSSSSSSITSSTIELKSDLKKTTAFIKKLRLITSDGLLQCLRDIQTLNLTLYISEIVSSIIEITIKPNDVPNLIKLCNELHLRYDDFTIPLITGMKDSLLSQDEEIQKRRRIQIRMIIEFYQIGLFNDESFFPILLRDLTGKTHPKYILYVVVVDNFCIYFYDFYYYLLILLLLFIVNKLIFLV